ncbi:MAG TPA: ribosomal L7Ae/L30e/S12e/Gadd45 family protein [Clostridia bacterium]|nr:ribosomal L7Ae/L30e/S12e/Gadd45 family protein [Clostridia bacterium]
MVDDLIVGIRQTRKLLHKGEASEIMIAMDADAGITGPLREVCENQGIPVVEFPTMAELGKYCGIEIGASVACRTK